MPDITEIRKNYELIKDILLSAFQTDAYLLEYPYKNLNMVDHGLRKMMWNDLDYSDMSQIPGTTDSHRLLVLKSNLGFYNIIASFGTQPNPSYISVGPFRDENTSAKFYEDIIQRTLLPQDNVLAMQQFFRSMPQVNLNAILNVLKRLLSEIAPEFINEEERIIEFTDKPREIQPNLNLINEATSYYAENYQTILMSFFESVKAGNIEHSRKLLHKFLHATSIDTTENNSSYKQINHLINTVCLYALFQTTVHPYRVLALHNRLAFTIDNTNDLQKQSYIPYDICHKYYLLIHNYNHPEYSKLTRDVINYISFHLEDELSLSVLAEHFGKNASSLSATFSKDTKISLTEYIHKERIHEAIRLLNATDSSISDIALSVGFHDFAYFSRIFKKEIGCSPRNYRIAPNS